MNWTEAQLAEHLARTGKPAKSVPISSSSPPRFALGRLKAGQMNRTEAAYASHLDLLKTAGEILWYRFEGIKLRLADNTFLTVDFAVMMADGTLEMHECKGYMEEDANVKLKVAAASYPFRFILVRKKAEKDGGGWTKTEY
jgi:hypothetical protein